METSFNMEQKIGIQASKVQFLRIEDFSISIKKNSNILANKYMDREPGILKILKLRM